MLLSHLSLRFCTHSHQVRNTVKKSQHVLLPVNAPVCFTEYDRKQTIQCLKSEVPHQILPPSFHESQIGDWTGCRHAADIRIHPTSFHSKLWRGCPSLPSPLCASCRSSHWDFLLWTPLLISMWHVSLLFLQGHRFLNLQIKSHHSSSEHAPNELGPQFWRAPWKGGPHSLLSWLLPSVTMWTRL